MPLLGTAGKNGNWSAPAYTVPALMTFNGHVANTFGTPTYRSLDIQRVIPKSKLAAVVAAASALGAKIQFRYGGWPMDNNAGASGFRLFLGHPARGLTPPWVAANVSILLDNIETAITT